jgi:hypothetical protein
MVHLYIRQGCLQETYTWKKNIYPSSDSISKGILDIVHLEEAQELEEKVTMYPTVYDNSNGTATTRL